MFRKRGGTGHYQLSSRMTLVSTVLEPRRQSHLHATPSMKSSSAVISSWFHVSWMYRRTRCGKGWVPTKQPCRTSSQTNVKTQIYSIISEQEGPAGGGGSKSWSKTYEKRKRKSRYITTLPRNAVTGATQNCRQRCNNNRRAERGEEGLGLLG